MYKISIPIMLSTINRSGGHDRVLCDLKKLGAERVFLALGEIDTDTKNRAFFLYWKKSVAFSKTTDLRSALGFGPLCLGERTILQG